MKLLKFSTQNSELAIRVSDAEAKILRVLVGSANGENYGYELSLIHISEPTRPY